MMWDWSDRAPACNIPLLRVSVQVLMGGGVFQEEMGRRR